MPPLSLVILARHGDMAESERRCRGTGQVPSLELLKRALEAMDAGGVSPGIDFKHSRRHGAEKYTPPARIAVGAQGYQQSFVELKSIETGLAAGL